MSHRTPMTEFPAPATPTIDDLKDLSVYCHSLHQSLSTIPVLRQSQFNAMLLLTNPKKIKNRENELLARTGVTKAGYLLKRQNASSLKAQCRWESLFFILNDHSLSYCTEKNNFSRPDGHLLLTTSTRVYNEHGEEAVIRIETGCEVLFVKGRDSAEIKEWKKAIHSNAAKLAELARGQFGVKGKNGKANDQFVMLHRECITTHPFYSSLAINKIYALTDQTTFTEEGNCISIKGDESFTLVAKNDIEQRNFARALGQTISLLVNHGSKNVISPPQLPLHSGKLLLLDVSTKKWTKKYLVMADNCIYIHGHRRVGFDSPQKHILTPNAMIFSTSLKTFSFEVVLFSESLHLAASSELEKSEWMYHLQKMIPKSTYNFNDPLQAASFDRELVDYAIEFQSSTAPGVILERRGNWAVASVVSDSLSRKISQGSMLQSIEGKSVVTSGFDAVLHQLSFWNAPLHLNFALSPQKMGWLSMLVESKSWRSNRIVIWEKIYATVCSGVLSIYTVLKDGKSKKQVMSLYGSAIGIIAPDLVSGQKNCFRVVNGIEEIKLSASSHDDMMDWSTAIAHGISMENGGGLLLDKAKKESTDAGVQRQQPSIFRYVGKTNDGEVKSIVFAKQLEGSISDTFKVDNPPPIVQSKSLDSMNPTQLVENQHPLNASRSTDLTEMNSTFKTLDPADLSASMQEFANNFFAHTQKAFPEGNQKDILPLQALRAPYPPDDDHIDSGNNSPDLPWLEIDRASSAAGSVVISDEDVVEKCHDLNVNHHINCHDFATLLRYNECVDVTEEAQTQKTEESEAGTFGLI